MAIFNTLECVALKQITFLHVDKLNDPFDPYFFFETDFNEDYQEILGFIQKNYANNLVEFKQTLPRENWKRAVRSMQEHLNNIYNSTFLFSTIEINKKQHPKDNLYMWSHYGDGHRSVAIKFDAILLAKAVLEQLNKPEGLTGTIDEVWTEIIYQNEPPKITRESIVHYIMGWDKSKLYDIMTRRLSLKDLVWKLEKEWRLTWRNDETRLKILRLNLIDDTIKAIYLGCHIADNFIDDIIFEAKRYFPKAEIYKAKITKGKFGLDFEQIGGPVNVTLAEDRKQKTEKRHVKNP